MDALEPLSVTEACSLHRIAPSGGEQGREMPSRTRSVARYVISTAETRAVCNQPEVVGIAYTDRMRIGMGRALSALDALDLFPPAPEERISVLHFLRGGLNFGLREAVHKALGVNRHGSAFLSSQRVERDGRWTVREDSYRKLTIPDQAVLLCGDVVATGATVAHGLGTVLEYLRETGGCLRKILFFTIGCARIEQILQDLDAPLRELSPAYEGSSVIYVEGRFRLAEEKTRLQIGLPGTYLVRTDALLAPAFAASQQECLAYPLERCAIYDAGSRAFDIPEYLEDVRGYWQAVAMLAEGGWTLAQALAERWPGGDARAEPDSADALAALAAERLACLR